MLAALVLLVAVTVLFALPVWTERHEARLRTALRKRELDELDREAARVARIGRVYRRFVA